MYNIGYYQTFNLCGMACDSIGSKYFAYDNYFDKTRMCFCGSDISTITRYDIYTGSNWTNIIRSNCVKHSHHIMNGKWTNAIYKWTPSSTVDPSGLSKYIVHNYMIEYLIHFSYNYENEDFYFCARQIWGLV